MTNNKPPRNKSEKERDILLEADMYLRGISMHDIAEKMELSLATVSRDIKRMHAQWAETRNHNITEAKNKELMRIDVLEREYWKGWNRSLEYAHSEAEALAGAGRVTVNLKSNREQFGDPRFLNGIMSCINKRCEILGLNAPKNIKITPEGGNWASFIGGNITINNNTQNISQESPKQLPNPSNQVSEVIDADISA